MQVVSISQKGRRGVLCLLFSVAALLMVAAPAQAQVQNNDPLETLNRGMFTFNETLDGVVFRPLATAYEAVLPQFMRTGVNNFFSNLFYPTVIINQALQGKFVLALQDTTRFIANSTFGVGGLFDVATSDGLYANHEDFGQTLGVWGLKTGPYLVLPLWGPSNLRDGPALVADYYTNPLTHLRNERMAWQLGSLALVEKRAELFRAERLVSGDKYLFVRDAYLQRREYLVKDGAIAEGEDPFLADD